MKKILTGLQPSGNITLGNYIGAIKQMIEYQDSYDSYIFVADLHSITVEQNPKELKDNIKNLLSLYLACGIDPNKNTIFIQSDNLYHANMSWLLECNTPYGELSRMTQFKDKSRKNANFYAGLFTYPILMAADILLYDIDLVPTGADQKQHVELTRDIAIKMNKKYGDIFKIPEPMITKKGAKIMDLVDPTKKMSKSDKIAKGVIYLLDDEAVIRKKIMSATTDSDMRIIFDPENKPGISNLINIYSSLSDLSIKEIEEKFKNSNYGQFKSSVADLVINTLKPIKEKYNNIIKDDNYLLQILKNGKEKTSKIAASKYEDLKNRVGLGF